MGYFLHEIIFIMHNYMLVEKMWKLLMLISNVFEFKFKCVLNH